MNCWRNELQQGGSIGRGNNCSSQRGCTQGLREAEGVQRLRGSGRPGSSGGNFAFLRATRHT